MVKNIIHTIDRTKAPRPAQEHWLLARARVKLIGKIVRSYSYLSAGHNKIELKDTQYMGGYTIHYLNGKVEEYEEKIGKVRSLRKIIKK